MAIASTMKKNVFDYSYNDSSAAKYHLSLQLNPGSFHFILIHVAENKAIGIGSYSFGNKDKIDQSLTHWLENPLFALPFHSISIYYTGKDSSLIPSGLYKPEAVRDIMEFNHRLKNGSRCMSNKVQALDAYIAFSIPSAIKNILDVKFVSYQLKHSSTSTLSYFIEQPLVDQDSVVLLDVEDDFFHLMVSRDKKMLFYNTFPYSSAEDFLYYMLYTLEKLKLNNEETLVLTCGNMVSGSGLHQLLKKYFKEVSFLEVHPGLEISLKLKEFEVPAYFKLFNQYLCE